MNRRMRASSVVIGLLVALAALSTAGLAQVERADESPQGVRMNTLAGPTGLLTVPTAYVTPQGQIQFGTSFAENTRSISANYGLTSGIEVGGTWLDVDENDSDLDDEAIANAKVFIVPANLDWFQVGVGIVDAFDAVDQSFYVIASSDLAMPPPGLRDPGIGLRVHVGYGSDIFDDGLIGGAELFLDEQLSVLGEWNGNDVNAGLRYAHDDRFRLQAGIVDQEFFLGSTYALIF